MAKLLLCHPLFLSKSPDEQASSSPYFPLGLLYLAAYVRENGHDVAIFDGTFQADESAFATALAQEKPDVVGISALIPTKAMALTLAKMAHDFGPLVMIGGPEPTKAPLSFLSFDQIDLVGHHEGEQTTVAILDLVDAGRLTAQTIPQVMAKELGIAYRDENGTPQVNPPRPPITDLDSLPTPARDLIDMDKYLETWRDTNGYASMTIATSRGCPYGCEWCQDAVHGPELRQRSPESVAAEMKELKERYAIDRLRVVDDVDGLERSWINQWAEAAEAMDAAIPFEALYDLERQDLPMLDVRDSL